MRHLVFVVGLLIAGVYSDAQTARVVGYLPTYRFSMSSQIEYCKLTHLNLAFANPDSTGNIVMPDISGVISDAQSDNPAITICISLGGAGLSTQQKNDWSNLIDIPEHRPAFISKIVDFVLDNDLDGVDMDLEWDDVTSGYSGFVTELDTALNAHNILLTVAFPNQKWYSNVTREALDAFDFINIMSYDATGPWNPSNPGQHSSYNFSVNGINYWSIIVGIPGEKLTLGVPFYGYDFVNSSEVYAFSYEGMVSADANNADLDNVGNQYYNGRPTIESKVTLASSKVSGIMIWELGQDSFNEYSLLSTIHNKYTALGITTTGLCGNETVSTAPEPDFQDSFAIYPNPASNYFSIGSKGIELLSVIMTNTSGQTMKIEPVTTNNNGLYFDISNLQNGLYFISIISNEDVLHMQKLIVI